MKKIKAMLLSEKVTSNTVEAQSMHTKSKFGERLGEKILYSPYETLYLVQEKKMQVTNHKEKELSQNELIKKFSRKNKDFKTKYLVFKDLRKNGHIVKTALKFGAEFRVYQKESKNKHSKWLCFPISEEKKLTWQEFSAKNRVAHSTKKNLLIAIVDDEGAISYYEIKWTRM